METVFQYFTGNNLENNWSTYITKGEKNYNNWPQQSVDIYTLH